MSELRSRTAVSVPGTDSHEDDPEPRVVYIVTEYVPGLRVDQIVGVFASEDAAEDFTATRSLSTLIDRWEVRS